MQIPFRRSPLRIGTRGSALALTQAEMARDRLLAAWPGLREIAVEIVPIATSGDRLADKPLMDAGGKGMFTKEIEEALLADRIDLAVHSMKDVPTALPDGLAITAVLEREDPRDVLVSDAGYGALAALPVGGSFGTSSLRRAAQVLMRRPDLRIVPFRGNVLTRIEKIKQGAANATMLAAAGLNRLKLSDLGAPLSSREILPAVAQGAIGIQHRTGDAEAAELLQAVAHAPSFIAIMAERALLAALDGSCRTPIAALAEWEDGALRLRGQIIRPDGTSHHLLEERGAPEDAARLGREMGDALKRLGGADFFCR